ncbi:MAG TPA: nuclear transport factor 2 family protein [Marmoricola sp.]|nr:nuclear transport factor 2 family protein [Marmoricola sp.]
MDRETRSEVVREAYAAYIAGDRVPFSSLLAPEVTFHVAGDHPLSGDYRGVDEVRRYLATVERLNGGPGGATLDTVFADETGDLVLLESTTRHGSVERSIGHVLRFEGDRLVELWDNPADPEAEDRHWRARVPAQRRPGPTAARRLAGAAPAPPLGSPR